MYIYVYICKSKKKSMEIDFPYTQVYYFISFNVELKILYFYTLHSEDTSF